MTGARSPRCAHEWRQVARAHSELRGKCTKVDDSLIREVTEQDDTVDVTVNSVFGDEKHVLSALKVGSSARFQTPTLPLVLSWLSGFGSRLRAWYKYVQDAS